LTSVTISVVPQNIPVCLVVYIYGALYYVFSVGEVTIGENTGINKVKELFAITSIPSLFGA